MLGTCKAIGDIDLVTAPAFNADVHDMIDVSDAVLVSVDCSGVTFMDSAGFHVLVDATEYAARRGHTLVICNMSPSCARLIRLCDWDRELRVEPSPHRIGRVGDAVSFSADSCTYPQQGLSGDGTGRVSVRLSCPREGLIESPFSPSHLIGRR